MLLCVGVSFNYVYGLRKIGRRCHVRSPVFSIPPFPRLVVTLSPWPYSDCAFSLFPFCNYPVSLGRLYWLQVFGLVILIAGEFTPIIAWLIGTKFLPGTVITSTQLDRRRRKRMDDLDRKRLPVTPRVTPTIQQVKLLPRRTIIHECRYILCPLSTVPRPLSVLRRPLPPLPRSLFVYSSDLLFSVDT